jgi:hypothetical protein
MVSWKFASPNSSNAKDGFTMGSRKLTPQDLESIAQFAKSWGKIVVRRAFGEQGPGLDVDLAQMEQIALAAARGVTAGAMEEATAQQAQQLGSIQPCPQCGRSCTISTETRPLKVSSGTAFEHIEPKCYCPACRRDFFPSASCLET